MILILSEELDASTNNIIDWLIYYRKAYIRINLENFIDRVYVDKEKINLHVDKHIIDFDKIHSFWYRKGDFSYKKLNELNAVMGYPKHYLFREWNYLKDFIFYKLQDKKGIHNNLNRNINKLIVLDIAKQVGLKVPDYYISDFKTELYEDTIIKAIEDNFDYEEREYF